MPKKEINLLPREEFEQKVFGRFLVWVLLVGRWIVVFTELIVIVAFLSRFKLDRDLTNLYESIREKQGIVTASASFEKDFRSFQSRLLTADKLIKNQMGTTRLISAVAGATPAEVAINNLTVEKGEIRIKGFALSEVGLKSFLAGLAQSFTQISVDSVSKNLGEEAGIKFSLSAEVKKEATKK